MMAAVQIFSRSITLFCIWLLGSLPHAHAVQPPQVGSIHILASNSLVDTLPKLAQAFSVQHNTTVSVTFDAPDILLRDISLGGQANLIITEDASLMKELKQRGLIDVQSLSILAKDSLVLVASPQHHIARNGVAKSALGTLANLNEKSLFILPSPSNAPLGRVGKAVLERLDMFETLSPFMMKPPTAQQARYQIEQGAGVGILYRSMADKNTALTTLAPLPDGSYDTIAYQTAVVASHSMEGARAIEIPEERCRTSASCRRWLLCQKQVACLNLFHLQSKLAKPIHGVRVVKAKIFRYAMVPISLTQTCHVP